MKKGKNMWALLLETAIIVSIPKLVNEAHKFFFGEDKSKKKEQEPVPVPSGRKKRDATLWTKHKIKVVRDAKKAFDAMNARRPKGTKKTKQTVLIRDLNAYLKLSKTRSCYARAWDISEKQIDLSTLIDGEPFYDNKVWYPE